MIYNSDTASIKQFDLSLGGQKPVTREPAGFGESFMQQLGSFWREDQSTSRLFALGNAQSERAQKIREVAGDKAFIRALTLSGDPATTQMIEELSAEHESVKTDAGLMADIKERNTGLRKERDAALEHQTTGGTIGGFLGVAAGAITDPLNLATLPLGASWATGILKTAAIEAGIAMGTEAAIQPAIYRYKKELESPYDLKDVLINIAGAGVGAGVLTGGVKATARAISRFGRFNAEVAPRRVDGFDDILETVQKLEDDAFVLGKPGEVPEGPRFTLNDEQRAAKEVLQEHANVLRQSPFEAVPELDTIHLDALAKATDDIEAGRAVDVSDSIEQPQARFDELSPQRELDDFDRIMEAESGEEQIGRITQGRKVKELLDAEDIKITLDDGSTRSAREVIGELDADAKAFAAVKTCLGG